MINISKVLFFSCQLMRLRLLAFLLLSSSAVFAQVNTGHGKQASSNETGAKIVAITVINGATRTNMRQNQPTKGIQNWGCVKDATTQVEVVVTTKPNTSENWNRLNWGNQGTPVPGKPANHRNFSRAVPAKIVVKPLISGAGLPPLQIWVIWSNYSVKISGNTDVGIRCESTPGQVTDTGVWWPEFGGGNALGPIDQPHYPDLNNGYTAARIESVAQLLPPDVEDVVVPNTIKVIQGVPTNRHTWRMIRTREARRFSNGSSSPADYSAPGTDDTGLYWSVDLNPTGTPKKGFLYHVDAPGDPPNPPINRTSEVYVNFSGHATVELDQKYSCSDVIVWSWFSRVDKDKKDANGNYTIDSNILALGAITVPAANAPYYQPR